MYYNNQRRKQTINLQSKQQQGLHLGSVVVLCVNLMPLTKGSNSGSSRVVTQSPILLLALYRAELSILLSRWPAADFGMETSVPGGNWSVAPSGWRRPTEWRWCLRKWCCWLAR